jgi:hypothetical protein
MIKSAVKKSSYKIDPLVKSISDYLRQGSIAQNRDAMRAELIELINTCDLSSFALSNAVRSNDPDVITAVVNNGGDVSRIPQLKHFSGFSFTDIDKNRRTEIFDLIAKHLKPNAERIERVGSQALDAQDIDMLNAIIAWAPNISLEAIVWKKRSLSDVIHANPEFWASFIPRLDMHHPDSLTYAARLVTQESSIRILAIMVAQGLPVHRVIAENPVSKLSQQSWLNRFRQRAGSAHGELLFRRIMPPVEQLITAPKEHLVALMGGLSNRQKRKLEAFRRKGKVPQSLLELEQIACPSPAIGN